LWYESFKFKDNPYQRVDPFKIDLSRLSWNRNDLAEEREKLDHFVTDVLSSNRVGLLGYGAVGSGKTWLARILQKEIQEKQKKSVFMYTRVARLEPDFSVIYSLAISSMLSQLDRIKKVVEGRKGKDDLDRWQKAFENEDLGKGLGNIAIGGQNRAIAERWLLGNRVSSSDLDALGIINPLDSDYKQYQMLRDIIYGLSKLFPTVVLVVDELENAPVKLASALSDSLRSMIDEFASNFALICLFTAAALSEWFEYGYSEALLRRIDYNVSLGSLKPEALPSFLRTHHSLYRKKDEEISDQLTPFSEPGASSLLKLMPVEKQFPSYFFSNCEMIARMAAAENVEAIGAEYVGRNKQKLPYQFESETFRRDDFRK
jgi:hypothetical protein